MRERMVSALGGFIAILAVFAVSTRIAGDHAAMMVVASAGASAVLVFAVPHGPLSQPWPLVGGHVISALIGVACARLVPDIALAAALAVGLSIGAMHLAHCIHPPGGATALTAVVGGPAIASMGYWYAVTPVLTNMLILVAVGVVFNRPFRWRRYPAAGALADLPRPEALTSYGDITHADFVAALAQMDSFIDVSEQDLVRLYELVTENSNQRHLRESA
jgi:CBS-domain-containing membrane protein